MRIKVEQDCGGAYIYSATHTHTHTHTHKHTHTNKHTHTHTHTCTHTQPVAQIVKLGTVSLGTSAPAVSAVGVDTSAEALKDRSERFVAHGSTVSLKNTGGPPRPGPKTQLGTNTHTHTRTQAALLPRAPKHSRVYMYIYMYIYMYKYVCMYVCMLYVCIYTYIYVYVYM